MLLERCIQTLVGDAAAARWLEQRLHARALAVADVDKDDLLAERAP